MAPVAAGHTALAGGVKLTGAPSGVEVYVNPRDQWIYEEVCKGTGYTAIIGKPPKGFVFIAQEKKPPYAVGVFLLDEESEDQGREEYRELLKQYSACKNSNAWPAYPSTVQEISLPRWAKKGV